MENFKEIDIHEAKKFIDDKEAIVVDIRDPESFAAGHIEGALQITNKNSEAFLKETDKEQSIIFCCYHGFSSQQAAMFFAQNGFKNVYSMKGGFEAWASEYGAN